MSFVCDWKYRHIGRFEAWTAELNATMQSLAAEVWLDHGEWNWTIYCGPNEWPGGTAQSAEEAMSAVQERISTKLAH